MHFQIPTMQKIPLLLTLFIYSSVFSQIINFPDNNFKLALLESSDGEFVAKNLNDEWVAIDTNNNGQIEISEAEQIKSLLLYSESSGITFSNITGIKFFTNLEEINIQRHNISFADFSSMESLKNITFRQNNTEVVLLNNMVSLSYLDLTGNNFSNLLISDLPNLKKVELGGMLNELKMENLPALDTLNAGNTSLREISFQNTNNLKYLNVTKAQLQHNSFSNLPNLEELWAYETFETGTTEVDISQLTSLKKVTFSINNLESIIYPQNNSIEYLDISFNNFTSFDKNSFPNLKYLDVHVNKIYDLDLSGLSDLEYLDYSGNRDETLGDTIRHEINLTNCNNLQFLNLSFNHFETLDLSDLSNLSELMCVGNEVDFPNSGLESIILKNCISLKDVYLNQNIFLESIDFSCSTELETVHAWGNASLKFINLKNGVNDDNLILYVDTDGSLQSIGIDLIETLPQVDPNIHRTDNLTYTPICTYNTVKGTVSFDFDGNGCGEDEGIQNIKINYESDLDNGFTFSQSDGKYIIYTKANSLTLIPINDLYQLWDFGLDNPVNINFTNTDFVNYDFCLAPNTEYNDLEIHLIPLDNARPGFNSNYKIVYSNKGNSILSGEIHFTYQELLMDFTESFPIQNHSESGLLKWNYVSLEPFETREILFSMNMNTPTEEPPLNGGDVLNFVVNILPIENDETPEDNQFTLNQTVVNSFDPNDKTCLQGELLEIAEVGKYVDYLIRFENTGSANAENIIILDYIDLEKFDLSSLTVINSSHNVLTKSNNGNKIEFIFENIQLPFDDENNDGYVLFKIKTKSDLIVGDTFSNQVSIYFDYNAPIITNNYSTRIIENLNLEEVQDKFNLQIYPNPTSDLIQINSKVGVINVEVFDSAGRLLKTIPVQNQSISTKDMEKGAYILKLNFSDNTAISKKLIKK